MENYYCWLLVYVYQTPNALSCVGEVNHAFFNISRLNKSCQYFKMIDKKNNVTFNVSEQHKTFQSLQGKTSSNEIEHFVKLCIRDLRSTGATQQGRVKRKLREEIRYYELTYACKHGGKKFKSHRKGARKTSLVVLLILNSFKINAKVKIACSHKPPLVGEVFYKKLLIKFYKIKNK